MLSATRRRVVPAVLTAALAAGVMGVTIPAQASTAVPSSTTTPAASSVVVPAAVTPAVLTPAQLAAAKAAAARQAAAVKAAARAARVTKIRTTAVRVARNQIGDRYVAGRTGPNSFDCSGLARYVVKKAKGRTLPHYSKAQYRATKRVSRAHLRPGDLVFFFKRGTHHVGIYIGHGKMVNATNPRSGVRVDRVFSGWYGSRYSGAGRLV